jgi:C4-dicarboxylate-specific signal transduction histidine kinase
MRHLAQGELQTPLAISGQDEVASLAHATNMFNQTAMQLRQRTGALEEKNQPEQAKDKLTRIDKITDRATKLCQHLKSFARKLDSYDVEETLTVSANDIRLEQVFVNLISNSLDAIQTRIKDHDLESQKLGNQELAPQIRISATQNQNDVVIHVHDNGCGMHPEQQSQCGGV